MTSTDRSGDDAILRRLTEICGLPFARLAGPADEVAGAVATWVALPGDTSAAAEVLRLAHRAGLAVVPRGAGTKIDWGVPPPQVDILLDTGRLAGIGHRAPDAPVVEVGAGTPLRAVQAKLERSGHRLAVDAPSPGATIGGVLATDESGPLRHQHGSPGEQIVGGSWLDLTGRLVGVDDIDGPGAGVLVSAVLRVQPLPTGQVWVTLPVSHPREADELVRKIHSRAFEPAAVELDLRAAQGAAARGGSAADQGGSSAARGGSSAPPGGVAAPMGGSSAPMGGASSAGSGRPVVGELAVLLEGTHDDVTDRADALVKLLGTEATRAHSAPGWWRRYPFRPTDVALRIEVPVGQVNSAATALRDAAGAEVPVRGAAGLGLLHAALPGAWPAERINMVVTAVRNVLLARYGRCAVLAAPPDIRRKIEP